MNYGGTHFLSFSPSRRRGYRNRWLCVPLLFLLILPAILFMPIGAAQTPPRKGVLIINEVGLSHALTNLITQEIVEGVQETHDLHVEFYSENLDLLFSPDTPSRADIKDWLFKKYGAFKLDAVVAVGPDSIDFLSNYTQTMFLDVPIVICGSSLQQAGNPRLDSRFTGTWMIYEPAKTIEVALKLFPDTRHVVIVGGSSAFDRRAFSLAKADVATLVSKLDFVYMSDLEMNQLLARLHQLPEHSVVLYTSFFEDADGHKFVNASKALPMVVEASNAPVFGMSDTYLGRGIVGGDVMRFQEQGKVTANIVSELIQGKKTQDIPIQTLPSSYVFDWTALRRWQIPENRLPAGSLVVFREPTLWERSRSIWITSLIIIAVLCAVVGYLQYSRKQLKVARNEQMQLSGMLINAQEHERSRVASELHDDFSQRVAILALGLESAEEATPASLPDLQKQLRELVNSTSELGADLHTLSHRLHSSTIESLGIVPAVAALCKEFTAQQNIRVNFTSNELPRSVHPDSALCVFRIVQESLRNSRKYSGAEEVEVDLRTTGERLEIRVRDEGRGFDLSDLRRNEGLGIRSMGERARLLGGRLVIHSQPGKGTAVEAWVPLQPAVRSASS
jgi:signal transduction histidine kinase